MNCVCVCVCVCVCAHPYELHLILSGGRVAVAGAAWRVIVWHSEMGATRGRFQLKMCEEEIRTERITERVSCGCV